MRNERTSARVAKIAAKVLAIRDIDDRQALCVWGGFRGGGSHFVGLTMGQVRTLAASALTQAPDKPKAKPRRRDIRIVKLQPGDVVIDRRQRNSGRHGIVKSIYWLTKDDGRHVNVQWEGRKTVEPAVLPYAMDIWKARRKARR